MIRLQVVERGDAHLMSVLKEDMRSGSLKTLMLEGRGGSRVKHKKYKGWMNWRSGGGVLHCEIHSRREGAEWQFLRSVVGRLSSRYSGLVQSINIQFPGTRD
ncbi:MAG TPA: hypothetical protein VFA60_06600 [Terriglobales bacterium]|nr:hypothetical protein [Terriglobales bacterium]